uniref:Uncharacterized protein n=1 Tax=Ditylenchus dipsaci TaxID=166011 RepID=A0A915EI59_9BILA
MSNRDSQHNPIAAVVVNEMNHSDTNMNGSINNMAGGSKRARVTVRRYSPQSRSQMPTTSSMPMRNNSSTRTIIIGGGSEMEQAVEEVIISKHNEQEEDDGELHQQQNLPSSPSMNHDHPQQQQHLLRRIQHHQQQQQQQQQFIRRQHELQPTVKNDEEEELLIADEGVSARDIGQFVRQTNFHTNIDIFEHTPQITADVSCLDVLDMLSDNQMDGLELRNTLAGMCVMMNRLILDNRYLLQELQSTRNSYPEGGINRFDNLVFKKRNIANAYIYPGDDQGIPQANLNKIADTFDLNGIRRNEGAINTLRKFVKYLLENIIPVELHTKFTVRSRSGIESLTELPMPLITMIQEICLEAVGLWDPQRNPNQDLREDMTDYLTKFVKYALQEMRRIPRKSKRPVDRNTGKDL